MAKKAKSVNFSGKRVVGRLGDCLVGKSMYNGHAYLLDGKSWRNPFPSERARLIARGVLS
jgi:hypothetical protein